MSMPIEYRNLIGAMLAATNEGRVKWNSRQDEYSVTLPDAVIILWSGVELPLKDSFVGFTLRDADRKLIDAWRVNHRDPDYKALHSLVIGAKRNASDLSNKLSSLTEIFNNAPSIGSDGDAGASSGERYGT